MIASSKLETTVELEEMKTHCWIWKENTTLWKGEGGKFYLIGFLFLKL